MKLGKWSTTPGSNNTAAPDGWPENQAPSTVNDCAREMMASIRTAFLDLQYIDQNITPTYVSATSFTVPGDQTSAIHAGRRLKMFDATATIATAIYATVVSSTFAVNTTITVANDAGQLTSSLSSFAIAILAATNDSLPRNLSMTISALAVNGTLSVSGAMAISGAMTIDNTLTVTGATTIGGSLSVSATAVFKATAFFSTTAHAACVAISSDTISNVLQLQNLGANGVNIKMIGPGATTPSKYMRVLSGSWQIVNNAYSVGIFTLDDSGNGIFTGTVSQNSDERLKANWRDLPAGFIGQLAGVRSGIYDRVDIGEEQVGVNAQDLRSVLHQAVAGNEEKGYLSVAYGNAALVACVELAKEVIYLKARLDELEKGEQDDETPNLGKRNKRSRRNQH